MILLLSAGEDKEPGWRGESDDSTERVFPIDRDTLIRHFGTYSLSRDYDLIFSVPIPNISGEDAVFVPVGGIHESRTSRECQPCRCRS